MGDRKGFIFYRSFADAMDKLPDETAGKLIKALAAYSLDGEEPDLDGIESALFELMRPLADRDEKNYQNGKRDKKVREEAKPERNASETEANTKRNGSEHEANTERIASETEANPEPIKEKEKEKEKEKDIKDTLMSVCDRYNGVCKSLPKAQTLSEARKRLIRARLKGYRMEDFETVFAKAEASDFLAGRSGKWRASFDWLMNEANFAKVLDGNYDNSAQKYTGGFKQTDMTAEMREIEELYLQGG